MQWLRRRAHEFKLERRVALEIVEVPAAPNPSLLILF